MVEREVYTFVVGIGGTWMFVRHSMLIINRDDWKALLKYNVTGHRDITNKVKLISSINKTAIVIVLSP